MKPQIVNKCECGFIGDDDELNHTTIHDVFATGDYWNTEVEVTCPKCGSDYIEQVTLCSECGEQEAAEGLDECQACFDKIEQDEITSHTCEGMDGNNGRV